MVTNRIIKFRAWNKTHKYITDDISMMKDYNKEQIFYYTDPEDGIRIDKDWVLMQFTGLQDIKGKDIYEGDIVKWDAGYEKFCKVVYDNHYCRFWLMGDDSVDVDGFYDKIGADFLHKYNYEVIGNIFETPQLLEKLKI